MRYVGLDLTSAFARSPRPIDVAILEDDLRIPVRLDRARWPAPELVARRDRAALEAMIRAVAGDGADQVWAVDGPRGLARAGARVRRCEVLLRAPGRTPCTLPVRTSAVPYHGLIRSSVDLFAALRGAAVELLEVFPGAAWGALASGRLARKGSPAGRRARRALLAALGITGLPAAPTPDQNDAALAAYVAWCSRRRPGAVVLVGDPCFDAGGERREGVIVHLAAGAPAVRASSRSRSGPPSSRRRRAPPWRRSSP